METNMRDLRVPKCEMATVKELVLKVSDRNRLERFEQVKKVEVE